MRHVFGSARPARARRVDQIRAQNLREYFGGSIERSDSGYWGNDVACYVVVILVRISFERRLRLRYPLWTVASAKGPLKHLVQRTESTPTSSEWITAGQIPRLGSRSFLGIITDLADRSLYHLMPAAVSNKRQRPDRAI